MLKSNVTVFLCIFILWSPAVAAGEEVQVWAVESVHKVRPEDPPQASNLVWSEKTNTITLAGAKNEHVPFQVVLSTPPPPTRYEKAASGFFIEVSNLDSAQGHISRDRIRTYLEHVVLCYGKSSAVGATGFWPDALAPLTDPFDMAAEFRSFVKNRAVWIDVQIPADAPAGNYTGTIKVTRDGKPISQLKLVLKVYDFALPEETHLITYIGVSAGKIAPFHDVKVSSPEHKRLVQSYYEFLYRNRMEPWFQEALQPEVSTKEDGDVVVHFDDDLYNHYMNTLKTKRVILESEPSQLRASSRSPLFSEAFNQRIQSYLRQVREYFERHGWAGRLVINSPIDEPNSAQQFADTRRWAELVHKAAPGIPFLVTKSPVPDRPEWGALTGYANNFSIHGNDLNDPKVKNAIREEQAKGGEITWYISCDQVYPQPNYFIDAPAMDPVMVPWITCRYGMNGILYWEINFWSQTPDPWIDPVTYLSGFLCSQGGILNGEGSLIYPGSRTRRYTGQANVAGPVSSIRFELLREGIEDYECLWLLKSLGDRDFADEAVKSMVVDVSAFSRNAADLFALRERIAGRIENLVRKSRK